jgi:hypothetical protein
MTPNWQLAIYVPDDDHSSMPVAKYLQRRQEGPVSWVPQMHESTIQMEAAGREWIATDWDLGILSRLILQFEAAAPRVEAGEMAIIRSGDDDEMLVAFFLIDPAPGADVLISLFTIDVPVIAAIYPISKLPGEVDTLYQYVRENHTRFSTPGTEGYCEFRGVLFPRDILVNSLRREASLGRRLYELLGEEISW